MSTRPLSAPDSKFAWLGSTACALVLFALWALIPRALSATVSGPDQQVLASLGVLPFLLYFGRGLTLGATAWRGSLLALLSGLLTSVGNLSYYSALSQGGMASRLAPLTALYPVVTVIGSLLLLQEKISRGQLIGIGLALVSIYLFSEQVDAGVAGFSWLPIISIGAWGISAIVQRMSVEHVSAHQATFAYLFASIPVSLVLLLIDSRSVRVLSVTEIVWGSLLGLVLAAGNAFVVRAYSRSGKAAIVATLSGLYWVLVIPVGVLFFTETVDARKGLAIVMALLATVALTYQRGLNA